MLSSHFEAIEQEAHRSCVCPLRPWSVSRAPGGSPKLFPPVLLPTGFPDRLDHSHEDPRFIPAQPRGLLHPGRPVATGMGERCAGACWGRGHPRACGEVSQVAQTRGRQVGEEGKVRTRPGDLAVLGVLSSLPLLCLRFFCPKKLLK